MSNIRYKAFAILVLGACGGPQPAAADARAPQLACGSFHTCAIAVDGTAKCWGSNDVGQLGVGVIAGGPYPTPTPVSGILVPLDRITATNFNSCAITAEGQLLCWGADDRGQLGDGTIGPSSPTPTEVPGPSEPVQANAIGGAHGCATDAVEQVHCWGYDDDGQLGDGVVGPTRPTSAPAALSSRVLTITAGSLHTCAHQRSGQVACWGRNSSGELGNGTSGVANPTPGLVLSTNGMGTLTGIVEVDAGLFHTCARSQVGALRCWGNNSFGQIGNDAVSGSTALPVDVVGFASGARAVATGGYHTCALTNSGGVWCWGDDTYGQLGDGEIGMPDQVPMPQSVPGLASGVVAIEAGQFHTCAVLDDHTMQCWGSDGSGQLGDGVVGNPTVRPTPGAVVGLLVRTDLLVDGFE